MKIPIDPTLSMTPKRFSDGIPCPHLQWWEQSTESGAKFRKCVCCPRIEVWNGEEWLHQGRKIRKTSAPVLTPAKTAPSFSTTVVRLNKTPETADEAIARVGENADQDWKNTALNVVHSLCLRKATLTTDDVWEMLETYDNSTHEPRALGAVMRQAAKKGWCEPTDRTMKSSRPECHSRPLQVWRSRIFKSSIPL